MANFYFKMSNSDFHIQLWLPQLAEIFPKKERIYSQSMFKFVKLLELDDNRLIYLNHISCPMYQSKCTWFTDISIII